MGEWVNGREGGREGERAVPSCVVPAPRARLPHAAAISVTLSGCGCSASTIDVTDLSREAEALLIWSRVQRKLGNADSDRRPEGAMRRAPQEEYLVSHKHPNRRPHSSLR